MSQSSNKSLVESIIQTFVGTITGFILTLVIFPMFGVEASIAQVSGITIAFMVVGVIKNFLIRRLFNWLHKVWLDRNQNKYQSLIESSILTISGTIISFWLSIVIYPYFGLDIPVMTIGGITIVFTITSIIKNYFIRRYFENIKIEVGS